jgi:ribosomal-protein-alanine N-acetyltransferase
MSVSYSAASPGDIVEMAVLEKTLFPGDAWSLGAFEAEIVHPDSFYITVRADADHTLVGYGGLRASNEYGGQGDIQTLAVAEAFRGQGIGAHVLDLLLEEAWSRGVTEVLLEVRADNDAAARLYSRAGFHEIARRPGYYQPGGIDAIVMRTSRHDNQPHTEEGAP